MIWIYSKLEVIRQKAQVMTQKTKNIILFTWISKFLEKNPQQTKNVPKKQMSTFTISVFNKLFHDSLTHLKFTSLCFSVTD